MEDLDGATDEVWFFRKGRAYELAQSYFGCTSNGSWDGLPLMGLPELGRASHWETRIMRDEVMSYGRTLHAVSSITLAAMEDLGWYLANYSAAQCMSWGYQQGCDYVKTRCGRGANDLSQRTSYTSCETNDDCQDGKCLGGKCDERGEADCRGGDWGRSNSYLAGKCEKGTTPCSQRSDNQEYPFNRKDFTCNAQCYTGPDRDGCAPCTPASTASTAHALHTPCTRPAHALHTPTAHAPTAHRNPGARPPHATRRLSHALVSPSPRRAPTSRVSYPRQVPSPEKDEKGRPLEFLTRRCVVSE